MIVDEGLMISRAPGSKPQSQRTISITDPVPLPMIVPSLSTLRITSPIVVDDVGPKLTEVAEMIFTNDSVESCLFDSIIHGLQLFPHFLGEIHSTILTSDSCKIAPSLTLIAASLANRRLTDGTNDTTHQPQLPMPEREVYPADHGGKKTRARKNPRVNTW